MGIRYPYSGSVIPISFATCSMESKSSTALPEKPKAIHSAGFEIVAVTIQALGSSISTPTLPNSSRPPSRTPRPARCPRLCRHDFVWRERDVIIRTAHMCPVPKLSPPYNPPPGPALLLGEALHSLITCGLKSKLRTATRRHSKRTNKRWHISFAACLFLLLDLSISSKLC